MQFRTSKKQRLALRVFGSMAVVFIALPAITNVCFADGFNDAAISASRRIDFKEVDADHDGEISRLEAHRWPRLEKLFTLVDADANGWVSRDEFEAFSPTPRASDS